MELFLDLPNFVVTRAPFRISFAGGGTDLPSFYKREYGAVVSTTIDKYVYVMINTCRPILHQGVDDPGRYRIRLSYSTTENVNHPRELKHSIVREAMTLLELDVPMDISTMADVPAGMGLGSSGTFSVALLHALHLVKGEHPTAEQLAEEAAFIEMELLGRSVGKQDHYAAAYGGLNTIRFLVNGGVDVIPINQTDTVIGQLFPSLMLFYTGESRDSAQVLADQQSNVESLMDDLLTIRGHAQDLENILIDGFLVESLGNLLNQTWMKKRKLANSISNSIIDDCYERALKAGALGGKICGAGGGGFLLVVVKEENKQNVKIALSDLDELKIGYEPNGSQQLIAAGPAQVI